MGKYMRQKAKTAGDVAVMEIAPSSLGVRTRARTLALQRLQKSEPAPAAASLSYLQLRNRRLAKPPILARSCAKRQRQSAKDISEPKSPNSQPNCLGREKMGEKEEKSEGYDDVEGVGGVEEASLGENLLEFEGRDRSTRESTPCSLIRDPEVIRTPGSSTRPACSTEAHRRAHNPMLRHIPTAHDMDEFFAGTEEQQQQQFIEKYNFDPVNDVPLPGRFEWVKLKP